jgi:hypothetical protein
MTGKAFYEAAGRAGKMETKGSGKSASRSGKSAEKGGRSAKTSGTTKPKEKGKYTKTMGEFDYGPSSVPQVQYRKRKRKDKK